MSTTPTVEPTVTEAIDRLIATWLSAPLKMFEGGDIVRGDDFEMLVNALQRERGHLEDPSVEAAYLLGVTVGRKLALIETVAR